MLMKSFLYATVAMLTCISQARAEPPALGHWVGDKPITLCDTKEQIDALVAAGKEQGNGFGTAYMVLYNTVDQWHEHTCQILPPGTGEITALGEPALMWFGDTQANVITAELTGNGGRTYWLLYNTGNITPEVKPSSIPRGREGTRSYIILPDTPMSVLRELFL